MKLKHLSVLSLALASTQVLAENITVTTNFKNLKGNPKLLIMVRGLNNQAVTPYILHLNKKMQGFTLPTNAHVYQITTIQIQYPRKTLQPCALSANPIIQKDSHILLSGNLTTDKSAESCHMSYSISMNEHEPVAETAVGTGGKPQSLLARMKAAFKKGYADGTGKSLVHFSYPGMTRYLTKLRTCSPGYVTAKDPLTKKPIVYHILGQKDGKCLVRMKMPDQNSEMRCAFSPKQTSVISSNKYIEMFSNGNLKINPNDSASKMYKQACQVRKG